VRDFAREACDGDEMNVMAAARGSEQPILSGLRYILERGLRPDQMNGLAA
jgi:hypothetical protein